MGKEKPWSMPSMVGESLATLSQATPQGPAQFNIAVDWADSERVSRLAEHPGPGARGEEGAAEDTYSPKGLLLKHSPVILRDFPFSTWRLCDFWVKWGTNVLAGFNPAACITSSSDKHDWPIPIIPTASMA